MRIEFLRTLRTKRNRLHREETVEAARAAEREKTPAYLSGIGLRFSECAISHKSLERSANNRTTSAASWPLVPVQQFAGPALRARLSIRAHSSAVNGSGLGKCIAGLLVEQQGE